MYDKNTIYPLIKEYDYDFVDFLNKGTELHNRKIKVIFEYNKIWNTEKQFLEHAYFERRTRDVVNTNYRIIE
jgi:hypothetical protein